MYMYHLKPHSPSPLHRYVWNLGFACGAGVRFPDEGEGEVEEEGMLPPVRCFTCNKVIPYLHIENACASDGKTLKEAMDEKGVHRMCCRRMVICVCPSLEETMVIQDESNAILRSFQSQAPIQTEERTD